MRAIPILLLLAAACTTYPDDCNRRALHELRTVERLIAETSRNLERGFTYVTEERGYRSRLVVCTRSDNVGFCTSKEPYYRERAVAIDPAAERRKLDSLLSRREELVPAVAECRPR